MDIARRIFTRLGTWTASPYAFAFVIAFTAAWLIIEPHSFDWHGIATLATWAMTLVIQRAEHRDTQAVHAKLDELVRVHGGARNELTGLDDKEPEEIERHRKAQA